MPQQLAPFLADFRKNALKRVRLRDFRAWRREWNRDKQVSDRQRPFGWQSETQWTWQADRSFFLAGWGHQCIRGDTFFRYQAKPKNYQPW